MNRKIIFAPFTVVLVVLTISGCAKAPQIDDLTAHLEKVGLTVTSPDFGELGSIFSNAGIDPTKDKEMGFGSNKVVLRMVDIDGVFAAIYRFESEKNAEKFGDASEMVPMPTGTEQTDEAPKIFQNKNFVLLIFPGYAGPEEDEAIARIENAFEGF